MVHTAPPYNATKDQEQTWFEDLAEVREAKRDSLSRAHTSAANPKDRAALRAAADPSRTLGPADEPVAFLRVDLNEGGPFYIGRHGLRDEDRNPVVLEWATPVALQYRGASHEDPRGVVRHRSFRTDEEGGRPNEILEFDDVVLADLARQVAALGKSGVDVIEGDDFLQDVLAQGRTPDMADIVRTIQAAQADIIRAPGQQLLVVQGGPGTGKTAIAVHRAAALTHPEATDPADRVLIVGPSRALLHYIRQVSHDLGGERVVGSTVDQLMSSDVTISDRDIEPSGAAALKGSAVMASVLDNALRDRIRVPDSEHEIALDEVGFGVPVIPRDVKEILEGIDAFPYIAGRERFRLVLESHVVTAARLSGQPLHRGWSARADRSSIEAFVDRVWPSLSAQAFLRDLYGSVDRLISAAGTLLNGEQIRLLRRQASPRLSEQLWSREDLPLLDYVSRQLREPSDTLRFDHIIIDEAQDLSAMAMNAIHSRSRTGAMTAVGDIAQSTGPAARDSWDELLDGLAPNSARSLTQLRYGYRVPAAVLEFASLLLPDAAPGVERPAVVIRSDHEPELHATSGESVGLAHEVVKQVEKHSRKGRFVGVICPTSMRSVVESAFRSANMTWADADRGQLATGINVVSPEQAKGLEFDAAVVVDPGQIAALPGRGLRLLYIALTRTTRYLDVVYPEGTLPVQLAGATPRPSQGAYESSPAPPVPVPGAPDWTDSLPRVNRSSSPGRRRNVEFQARQVLDHLSDIGSAGDMWEEVLRAALEVVSSQRMENQLRHEDRNAD